MHTLTITGASDDLIEIGGDWQEELNHYWKRDDMKLYCGVSDGSLFEVKYDDNGLWRFTRVLTGRADMAKVEGDAEKDTNDVVTLTMDEPFKWVVCGDQMARK